MARSLNYPDSIAIEPSLAVASKFSYFYHYDPTDNKAIPSLIELWDIWRHVASKPVICFSWQAFRYGHAVSFKSGCLDVDLGPGLEFLELSWGDRILVGLDPIPFDVWNLAGVPDDSNPTPPRWTCKAWS